jgi:hypothetical protein
MSTGKKSSKQTWGIWLGLGGGLLCTNPYFILFAFPITLVGIGLIWASELDIKAKLAFSALPWLLPVAFYSIIVF